MPREGQGRFAVPLYLGLVHFPVYNKRKETIASSITVVDLHDLARAAKTFGVPRVFVVTPLNDQRALAEEVVSHWVKGYGASYNPDRREAMEGVTIVSALEEAIVSIRESEGRMPLRVATDAAPPGPKVLSCGEARSRLARGEAMLLLFGTAWGLNASVLRDADFILEPILGTGTYNHLSVRSAVAIFLDRLRGPWSGAFLHGGGLDDESIGSA